MDLRKIQAKMGQNPQTMCSRLRPQKNFLVIVLYLYLYLVYIFLIDLIQIRSYLLVMHFPIFF